MRKFHWLILYDISDNKRLQKIAKISEKYGVRVQYSCFETYCSESVIKELTEKVKRVIDKEQDYLVIFKVCEKDWQKQEKFGKDSNFGIDDFNKSYEIL